MCLFVSACSRTWGQRRSPLPLRHVAGGVGVRDDPHRARVSESGLHVKLECFVWHASETRLVLADTNLSDPHTNENELPCCSVLHVWRDMQSSAAGILCRKCS